MTQQWPRKIYLSGLIAICILCVQADDMPHTNHNIRLIKSVLLSRYSCLSLNLSACPSMATGWALASFTSITPRGNDTDTFDAEAMGSNVLPPSNRHCGSSWRQFPPLTPNICHCHWYVDECCSCVLPSKVLYFLTPTQQL